MKEHVLITGGAGFIGRHVAQKLLNQGATVRILDSFIEQVHGGAAAKIADCDIVRADVRDKDALDRALQGIDSVVHLAAEVGVGQSMYAVERYVSVNDCGTACLFEALARHPVRRVVTASSMSVYGEGLYRTADGTPVEDAERISAGADRWDPIDGAGRPLLPVPTPETKRPQLSSVYALTKYVQERLTLVLARNYSMESVALRLFNVFGPGQALSNPYTGVLAIFASRLLNGNAPLVFEDGQQRRDFVHVSDVAQAFYLALTQDGVSGQVFNIGSGQSRTVESVACDLARSLDLTLTPDISGLARAGDIRHCFADIGFAQQRLGFEAKTDFMTGLRELAAWLAEQNAEDRVEMATRELRQRGLVS